MCPWSATHTFHGVLAERLCLQRQHALRILQMHSSNRPSKSQCPVFKVDADEWLQQYFRWLYDVARVHIGHFVGHPALTIVTDSGFAQIIRTFAFNILMKCRRERLWGSA